MTPERLHQHLEELLARLGVAVRSETFDPRVFGDNSSRGGLCRLHDRTVVLVDARAPLVERVAVLAAAAASLDIDSVFVPPAVRAFIESHGPRPSRERRHPVLRLVRPAELLTVRRRRE